MKTQRIKQFVFIAITGLLFFWSCGPRQQLANPSEDARVLRVVIQQNDSSPNAALADFTINHDDSIIFNVDSLPYGTRVDSLYINFTFASSSGFIINDTVPESPAYNFGISSGTSGTTSKKVDFSTPVKIKNLASDTKHSKGYTIELRVHKVETYLHTWTELSPQVSTIAGNNQKAVLLNDKFYYFFDYENSNELFTSTDAATWTSAGPFGTVPLNTPLRDIVVHNNKMYLLNGSEVYISENGSNWDMHVVSGNSDYKLKAVLFSFKDKLWAVATHNETKKVRIASSTDGINWEFNEQREFSNFPVSNFSAIRFRPAVGREKVLVTGGNDSNGNTLNTLWSAEDIMGVDTLYWVNLQHKTFKMNPLYNAGTAFYGSKVLMLGGSQADEQLADTLYQLAQSIDEGLTWTKPDSLINQMPENYKFRTSASVVHDEKNYSLYIFGGVGKNEVFSDVWKVKVNFYSFQDYLEDPTKY